MEVSEKTIELTKIDRSDFKEVGRVATQVYSKILSPKSDYSYITKHIDPRYSIVARDRGEIVGGYILKEDSLDYDNDKFIGKNGIQGYALFLKEEYRNRGIGDQLRKYPGCLGFDYIFGLAFPELNNANHWIKFGRYLERIEFFNLSYKFYKVDIPSIEILNYFYPQDKFYNCGAVALEAILNFLEDKRIYTRKEIEGVAGTNPKTGTTHEGVEKVIEWATARAFRNIFREKDAFTYLDHLLDGHNLFLLRGLSMGGEKHWYVVISKNSDLTYNLLDPCRGLITLSKGEVEKIWRPREYDGFGFYR